MSAASDATGFEVTASRKLYEGVLSDVRVDTLRGPDDGEFEREVVEHIDAVGVVPLTSDGQVVLIEQYRHAIGRAILEIPAGMCDVDDEEPEATAARELAEEVALAAEELSPLGMIHNSAGWTDETTHIFLGTGVRSCERPDGFALAHEEAAMQVVRLPLDDAVAAVRRGEITDAKTVAGLLLAAPGR